MRHPAAIDAMLDREFGDIAELIHRRALERPDHISLIQGGRHWLMRWAQCWRPCS
jgi:hypothetical protein